MHGNPGRYPPGPLCRDCDTTYPQQKLSECIKLANLANQHGESRLLWNLKLPNDHSQPVAIASLSYSADGITGFIILPKNRILLIGPIITFLMYTVCFCCAPVFVSYLEKQLVMTSLSMSDMKYAAENHGTYATDMQSRIFPCIFHLTDVQWHFRLSIKAKSRD